MKTEFNSTEINENQVRLNNLDWGGGKNAPRGKSDKKPKGERVFSIRLIDRDGEKVAVVNMPE